MTKQTATIAAFDTSKFQLVFEAFLIPASLIIICVVVMFGIYLMILRIKGYYPVVAFVSKDDSELIDVILEAQQKVRGDK